MKILYLILILFSFSSCCNSYDGGYPSSYYDSKYFRKIVLTDKSNSIVKISYKGSNKVFTPNSDSTDLLISDNALTTLYIETKNNKDTLVINIKTNYSYYPDDCDGDKVVKNVDITPQIISHTFSGLSYSKIQTEKYSWGGGFDVYDIINITP